MNKIYIEASVGELIDKITILEIKKDTDQARFGGGALSMKTDYGST